MEVYRGTDLCMTRSNTSGWREVAGEISFFSTDAYAHFSAILDTCNQLCASNYHVRLPILEGHSLWEPWTLDLGALP